MTEKKRKMLPGVSRARRTKTGKNRGMLILISDEEKLEIERSSAQRGVSMSRFIVERVLSAAKRTLDQMDRSRGTKSMNPR